MPLIRASILALLFFSSLPTRAADGLVVHEWGVAIRHPTAHGTLLASPAELTSGLPSFVIREKQVQKLQAQGWDKPVLWFYGPEQTSITVSVSADLGFATAHFPPAQLLTRRFSHTDRKAMMVSLLTESAGYSWKGTLTRQPTAKMSEVPSDHWWHSARQGDSLYFNTKSASERFLFYEATAFTEPAVSATLTGDGVTVNNADEAPCGQVLLLINSSGRHHVHVIPSIAAKDVEKVAKEALLKSPCSAEALLAACAAQWTHFGMTESEGKTIAGIWRDDLLKPERCLLLSRMPPKKYEKMFPLTIDPAPAQVVRVGMVFDSLDAGAATWLPGREKLQQAVAQAAADLSSGDWKTREKATKALSEQGLSAKPLLEQLARSDNPEVSSRAQILLKKLLPAVPTPAKEGTDEKGVVIRAVK